MRVQRRKGDKVTSGGQGKGKEEEREFVQKMLEGKGEMVESGEGTWKVKDAPMEHHLATCREDVAPASALVYKSVVCVCAISIG